MSGRIAWPKLRYPLVAILRGIRWQETEAIVGALIETGFEAIEIPLNSPEPFVSIEKAAKLAPANVLIGAGTVLTVEDVDRLNDVGGRLLVSPNVEPEVIRRAGQHGMVTMPGVFTPTEAFTAIRAGASALKFFPASVLGADGIKAVCAVLPKDVPVGAVTRPALRQPRFVNALSVRLRHGTRSRAEELRDGKNSAWPEGGGGNFGRTTGRKTCPNLGVRQWQA